MHVALAQHFHCRQVRRSDDPFERALGFHCDCGGREEEWRVPLTDLRHYDRRVVSAFELLAHADEEENWEARRRVDVLDIHRMALEVSQLARRRQDDHRAEEKVRDAARRKARTLLRKNLSRKEWKEFLAGKAFHITGSDGRLYRISHRLSGNVTLVVDGKEVERYCLVPKGHQWIPEPDMMLAVKLMLQSNARSFLRKANATDLLRAG